MRSDLGRPASQMTMPGDPVAPLDGEAARVVPKRGWPLGHTIIFTGKVAETSAVRRRPGEPDYHRAGRVPPGARRRCRRTHVRRPRTGAAGRTGPGPDGFAPLVEQPLSRIKPQLAPPLAPVERRWCRAATVVPGEPQHSSRVGLRALAAIQAAVHGGRPRRRWPPRVEFRSRRTAGTHGGGARATNSGALQKPLDEAVGQLGPGRQFRAHAVTGEQVQRPTHSRRRGRRCGRGICRIPPSR